MKQTSYQFTNFTTAEFEQFRTKMGLGLVKIVDKIDFVGSAALVIGGTYNRTHNVLNVVVSSNELYVPDTADFQGQVLGLVGREAVTDSPVQAVPVKTPIDKHGMLVSQSGFASKAPAPPSSNLAVNLKAAFATTPVNSNLASALKEAFTVTPGPVSPKPPIKPIVPQATAAKKA